MVALIISLRAKLWQDTLEQRVKMDIFCLACFTHWSVCVCDCMWRLIGADSIMHPFSTSPFHQLASPTGLRCFLTYSQNAKNVQWLHMDLELKNIILAHVKQPTMWKPYVITCFVKGLSAGGRTLDLMQLFHLSGSHIKNFKGWKSFKKWINNFICIAEPGIHHLFSTCPSCFFFLLTIYPPFFSFLLHSYPLSILSVP